MSGQITAMGLAEILNRVDRRLKKLGLNDNSASEMAGKKDAIRNMRRAIQAGRDGVNTGTISALAPVLETTIAWLMEEAGEEDVRRARPKTRVVGYAGAGAETHFYAVSDQDLDEVDSPVGATADTKAIEIRGDSLGAMFDRWYAFFDDVRSPVTDDLYGQLCVVGIEGGERTLIKKLKAGSQPGLFQLLSEKEAPIEDVEVTWAARVKQMTPR